MRHDARLWLTKCLALGAGGVLLAVFINLAASPSRPHARQIERAVDAGSPRIELSAATPKLPGQPSAFGFLEFDWSGPDAVPGFGPWENQTASATRTTHIARTP